MNQSQKQTMIETTRTCIRAIDIKDNRSIFTYRQDAKTNKYQGWIPKTLKEVDEFIAKTPTEFNKPETWFQLVIIEKTSETIIGDIGIHFMDPENYQCELGITLNKQFHGKGFATESLNAVINLLFKDLNKHRIVTSIDPANSSSINLVERLGFRKEAHFVQSLLIDGKWVDDIIYAMLRSEW